VQLVRNALKRVTSNTITPQHDSKESGSSKTLNEENVMGLLLSYKRSICKRKRTHVT